MSGVSLNECQFIGRLTADPVYVEDKTTGSKRAHFSIAVNATWKDRDGHRVSQVQFVDFLAWGNHAVIARKFLHKAMRVWLKGRLETSQWTNDKGEKKKKTQIVVARVLILQHARKDDPVQPPDLDEDDDP